MVELPSGTCVACLDKGTAKGAWTVFHSSFESFTTSPRSGCHSVFNGGGGPLCSCRQGVPYVLNTLLALLAVAAVMAVHGVAKLVLLPFRALSGLFRRRGLQVHVTAA